MLLKCQINTNTKKIGFLHPKKCLERVLKYSHSRILLALAHTSIALTHLNSTEKLHRLYCLKRFTAISVQGSIKEIWYETLKLIDSIKM